MQNSLEVKCTYVHLLVRGDFFFPMSDLFVYRPQNCTHILNDKLHKLGYFLNSISQSRGGAYASYQLYLLPAASKVGALTQIR